MQISNNSFNQKEISEDGRALFHAVNPATGLKLPTEFYESTSIEIDQAIQEAEEAFKLYRKFSGDAKANFLEQIGEEILALGSSLIETCMEETALPEARLIGERGRTVNQLKMFAQLVREGSWVGAIIDTALPERKPLPRADIRQMKIALGPVGVFGASNFPLAFSVAGGDTASALAAGCTVVFKAHQAHPATSAMVAEAINRAAKKTNVPEGVFHLIQGESTDVGISLVNHPLIKAIGFTGSFFGGKALFDAAGRRAEPIPVYAEMGSINPVFILPEALKERNAKIAEGLAGSLTMGVGQFCTNPGVVVSLESEDSMAMIRKTGELLTKVAPGPMLSEKIRMSYDKSIAGLKAKSSIELIAEAPKNDNPEYGAAGLFQTSATSFIEDSSLSDEIFGPSTLSVTAKNKAELLEVAKNLHGHLTATIHATAKDLEEYGDLVEILERKVGRVLINGFPTGVEVGDAMVHGGPFPATTDSRTTSVGTTAIDRFVRPVCYQDFPQSLLPEALHDKNPLKIWRKINGSYSKEAIEN